MNNVYVIAGYNMILLLDNEESFIENIFKERQYFRSLNGFLSSNTWKTE